VVATPFKNAWHGAVDYDRVQRENEELREQIAQQRGDQLAARAIYSDYQELLTLNGLIANYQRVTARVVGDNSSNFSQTVEIDRGSDDGIRVGMGVVSSAGLVGRITYTYSDRSVVLLVTDQEYTIECKVSGATPLPPEEPDETDATTPSGENVDDLGTTTTSSTTTTIAASDDSATDASVTDGTATDDTATDETGDPDDDSDTGTTVESTTTTSILPVTRETGGCQGRGEDQLPVMKFVTDDPYGPIGVGDVVSTAGGANSLVPPDIVIGEVVNKIERPSSAGPLLEIELAADLERLSLVQVVLSQPGSEAAG
jgi:rod shape-determining protein MreC